MRSKKQVEKELEFWKDILHHFLYEPDLFGASIERPVAMIDALEWLLEYDKRRTHIPTLHDR